MKEKKKTEGGAESTLWIERFFRSYTVRTRFLLLVILLCILPLLGAMTIVFFTNYNDVTMQYVSFAEKLSGQIESNLESRLLRLRADAIDLAYNQELQSYVRAYYAEKTSAGRVPVTDEVAHAIISKFNDASDASGLLLYMPDGTACYGYTNRSAQPVYMREEYVQRLMQEIQTRPAGYWAYISSGDYYQKNSSGQIYNIEEGPIVFYSLKMKHLVGSEYVGYLVMSMRSDVLEKLFANCNIHDMTTMMLLDEEGNVIIGNEEVLDRVRQEMLPHLLREEERGMVSTRGGLFPSAHVTFTRMPDIGWYVVDVIDGGKLSGLALNSSSHIFVLALLVLCLVVLVFFLLNQSVERPLNRILKNLHGIRHGRFNSRIHDTGKDEFTQISDSIDTMAAAIENMLQKIKDSEKQYSETQMELLQMQINPHFITNTLNSVAGMAEVQGQVGISRVLTSLASLLNQTLRSGREFVTLREELQYVQWYVDIQQYHSVVSYSLNVQVDEALMEYLLPPFTLEPLVENSVNHGAVQGRDTLTIAVKALRVGDTLEMTVIDNGCGMDEDTLEKLKAPQTPASKPYHVHGIGIANVRRRLDLYFGAPYGLFYDSVVGSFTMVRVRIPAIGRGERPPTIEHGATRGDKRVSCDDRR